MKINHIWTTLIGLLFCSLANADVVRFDFTGQAGNQASQAATFADPLLVAGPLVRGSGVTATSGANSMNSSDWSTGALAASDYYEFTISSNSLTVMTLATLSFGERRSATGIRDFVLRSSLDGFSTFTNQGSVTVPDNASARDHQFALTGLSALAGGTTVSFRLYGFNAKGASGTWRLVNHVVENGLTVDGIINSISIPEPSGISILGLGLFGACALRMRRKKQG